MRIWVLVANYGEIIGVFSTDNLAKQYVEKEFMPDKVWYSKEHGWRCDDGFDLIPFEVDSPE